jgi:hypothetical protein
MLKVCLVCAWRQLAVWRGSPPPLPADSWWQTVGGLYLGRHWEPRSFMGRGDATRRHELSRDFGRLASRSIYARQAGHGG